MRGYARSLVPDWDLVDEALQEASVTMWQKRGQLQSPDGFVPWARVILRFKCLQQLEKLRTRLVALSAKRHRSAEVVLSLVGRWWACLFAWKKGLSHEHVRC